MKNLAILICLFASVSAFSQKAHIKIIVNVDNAQIALDGKDAGFSSSDFPLLLDVTPGRHQVTAVCGDKKPQKMDFKAKENKDLELTFKLECERENAVSIVVEDVKAEEEHSELEEPVFLVVDEPASFQEGDLGNFNKWVGQNIHYPETAAKAGITGKVYVQFVVNKSGNVVNVKVIRGVDPILDAEAVRVISSSPKWSIPKQGGKPANQQFMIPIYFGSR